jgi:hypothetical protein
MQKGDWIPQIGSLVKFKSLDELNQEFCYGMGYDSFSPREIELTKDNQIKHFISIGNGYRGEISLYSNDYAALGETPAEVIRGRWCGGKKHFPILLDRNPVCYHPNFTAHFGRGAGLMMVFHWASGKHLLIPRKLVKPFENSTQEAMQT